MKAGLPVAVAVLIAAAAVRPTPPARRAMVPASRSTRPRRWRAAATRDGRRGCEPAEVARWCDQLARAVRSGSTLTAAVRATAPPAGATTRVGAVQLALERGASLVVALGPARGVATEHPDDPHLDLALTVLRACAEHGGPPGEPIDRAAATLRARAADLADRRTHSAQARLSAVVMTVLPIAMLVLLVANSAGVRSALATPAGGLAITVGFVLNLGGWRWMRRIIEAHP